MKLAKKRLSPIVRRLLSSTRGAKRAITKAIASVDATNRKLAMKRRKPQYSLDEMLEAFDPKRHRGELMTFAPRGRESGTPL